MKTSTARDWLDGLEETGTERLVFVHSIAAIRFGADWIGRATMAP